MFASAASSERPRDIFREPALSVGIFALGAQFAASDDCSQHPGGCAKNFVNSGDPCVIPSKVEGSRSVTLKLSHRDASAAAQDDGKTELALPCGERTDPG